MDVNVVTIIYKTRLCDSSVSFTCLEMHFRELIQTVETN